MRQILLTAAASAAIIGLAPQAYAQKEAIGMFYELQMAPKVCNWKNAGDGKKLDSTIVSQEQGLGVSAAEKADMMQKAEADLKSDPANCAPDGMVRAMYDEAVK